MQLHCKLGQHSVQAVLIIACAKRANRLRTKCMGNFYLQQKLQHTYTLKQLHSCLRSLTCAHNKYTNQTYTLAHTQQRVSMGRSVCKLESMCVRVFLDAP